MYNFSDKIKSPEEQQSLGMIAKLSTNSCCDSSYYSNQLVVSGIKWQAIDFWGSEASLLLPCNVPVPSAEITLPVL